MIQFISENMESESFRGDALSLIVSYNDWQSLEKSLNTYRRSFPNSDPWPLLIIDNGSGKELFPLFQRLNLGFPCKWIQLSTNIGVASAYNLGLRFAGELGAPWLFILDQDSSYEPGLQTLLYQKGLELYRNGCLVGAIAPTVRSSHFPDIVHFPYHWNGSDFVSIVPENSICDNLPLQIDSTVTSGTLYNAQALRDVQGFRDDFFIDFVDHECHLRIRNAGWELWWVPEAELSHNLGAYQKKTTNGIWIEHEPYRYYYMARNMIAMYWKFGRFKGLINVGRNIFRHCGLLRKNSTDYRQCIFYIRKGIIDALTGRFGPLDTKI